MRNRITKLVNHAFAASITSAVLAVLCVTTSATACDTPTFESSCAFGSGLNAFEDIYWRWNLGDITIPQDKNGNAIIADVVLVPIPSTPGDGTPGSQNVTLDFGESFMLPLWAILGTSYTDGTPPDPFVNVGVFKTLNLTLTIDGKTIINSHNLMDFYSQFRFAPAIPLNDPPINSVIWFQGIGLLHEPLTTGNHVFKLDAKNTENLPPYDGGGIIEYHNTWYVTVSPKRK
jgi:hypothetical protein